MNFDPERITFFAKTDARGQQVPFGIKAKDRQRHMYVIGKTGMGKSTLLENMAVQDIQNGEGMAFIDPHGSAAETLLEYIPEERMEDVIYFAPFDMENPISFNVMEDVGADKRHLVVSGLMSTFKKIWVDAWSARMEYILTNALLALLEYPDSTLLSVNRMLSDKAYRKKVVENITDPAVRAYWVDEFASYTERFAAEALPAIQNKIGQFTGNPLIRNIIGQPKSSFDIRDIMDNKKILIMNLSKGLVGETNANLLGSMLTTRIYLAAMSRADLSPQEMKGMPNFYFYVDEFQSFANSTFANILSEARKYHLNLIIAHQYIEQMEEEVRDAVFGNVGTTISFRVGPFDADVLETVYTPTFLAPDLVNLGFAQIYLTLMIDGIGSKPFSAVTLPPIETPSVSYRDMAIAASREKYTNGREGVEKLVAELHEPERKQKVTEEKKGPPPPPEKSYSERMKEKEEKEKKEAALKKLPAKKDGKKKLTEEGDGVEKRTERTPQKEHTSTLAKKSAPTTLSRREKKAAPKDLTGLRSVLKDMSTDGKKKAAPQESGGEEKKVVKKPGKVSTNKNELKNALSGILSDVKQKESSVPKQVQVQKQAPASLQKKIDPESSVTKNETVPQKKKNPVPKPQFGRSERKGHDMSPHTFTSKDLERMMRVPASDKSPLR